MFGANRIAALDIQLVQVGTQQAAVVNQGVIGATAERPAKHRGGKHSLRIANGFLGLLVVASLVKDALILGADCRDRLRPLAITDGVKKLQSGAGFDNT